MSIQQALIGGYENLPASITVDAADFDGDGSDTGSPTLKRGAGLTGAADSKKGTVSFWIDVYNFNIARRILVGTNTLDTWLTANVRLRVTTFTTPGSLAIEGYNAAGTVILELRQNVGILNTDGWVHVLSSWDLGANKVHYLINGVDQLNATKTVIDDTIDYTLADWGVCRATSGGSNGDNSLAELWFAPGHYIDFSYIGNVRRFRSATGKPSNLGSDGSLPLFGAATPLIYMHLNDAEAVSNFQGNDGSGGTFTQSGGGTYATASTSPSD